MGKQFTPRSMSGSSRAGKSRVTDAFRIADTYPVSSIGPMTPSGVGGSWPHGKGNPMRDIKSGNARSQ